MEIDSLLMRDPEGRGNAEAVMDHILSWTFKMCNRPNHTNRRNDELLKECRKILSALIGVDITGDECTVVPYMQWEKIDIVVEVVLQNGERHAILIENKVKAILPPHELYDNKIKFKQFYDNDGDRHWHQHYWLIHAYVVPEYMKKQCDIDGYTYITLDELSHSSGPDLGNDIFDEFWRRKW